MTGEQIGLMTGEPGSFTNFDDLYDAFEKQLEYIVDLKIKVNNIIEKM